MTKPTPPQANTLYPGLPNYAGETRGWFLLPWHSPYLVYFVEDISQRVKEIPIKKPEHERETRLRHIVYVPEELVPVKLRKTREVYGKAWEVYDKAWEVYDKAGEAHGKAWKAANKSKKLLAYLHKNVPDCKWNGTEIIFPPKP